MSNPGVITLTEKEISASKRFRVEDNLGESIHFHYNDIRIDLTIQELLYIGKVCDESIYDLVKAQDFNLDDYDGDFLNAYSQCFMDLESVTKDTVSVKDLYVQTKNALHLPVRRKLKHALAKKLVEKKVRRSRYDVDKESYPVVLFNDNNTVMYGEKQVAKLFLENEQESVPVLRMNFEKGKYSVSKHPWIPFLFKWNKKRFIKVAKKAAMKLLK